ncbi:MAG: citramalate synthase [Alphaproteobacteria bacterium]|nr:MAG: citramalate synthase [Alphaproteobacteria bacterium]
MNKQRVYLYDSTLRDGSQMRGVDFTVSDKIAIAKALDEFGIDYIEGGWPGANPRDDAFFDEPPILHHAKLTAFGMTRRAGASASNDPTLAALLNQGAQHLCLVGKTWDFHIHTALGISEDENEAMIYDSIAHMVQHGKYTMFDAEHFFDGFKQNKSVALRMVQAAYRAGAQWVVLCDTNGGTLPHEIYDIVREVGEVIPAEKLGIHCHNDTGNAGANSLAAVLAGARHVQGTINGIGERCGNADLITLIPNLMLKMQMDVGVSEESLAHLVALSRMVDERLDRTPNLHAPYVGMAAFAHKGGLHVSAMAKSTKSYEHIPPESVGNKREIIISDKAGRSNILSRLKDFGMVIADDDPRIAEVVHTVKQRETQGYSYEAAPASFELLAHRMLQQRDDHFSMISFRVLDERRWNARGELVTLSEATIKLLIGQEKIMVVDEGNGPVNALDGALRKALIPSFPILSQMRLTDYKVRIISSSDATAAVTRVVIESMDHLGNRWSTVGVSPNVIDASYNALHDAIHYMLLLHPSTVS